MGLGILIFFVIVPLTVILLLIWAISRKAIFGKLLGLMWLGIAGIIVFSISASWLFSKKELSKSDYYGQYVVNRDYFSGEQADWQYNHFRFEITDQDSIFFHMTDYGEIVKTYRGSISTSKSYKSARLRIKMDQPTHHIMAMNPTTYRNSWSFYMVFYSSKFNNVFFKKGKWKPID